MTLLLIIIFISILILVHEWGHFYSARKFGVKVEEFGFGFPPRLFSKVKNGIVYSFNILPFGGFVKIFGEHGEGEGKTESFISRPIWQRFIILGAGVFMNLVLAWFLFSTAAALGIPKIAQDNEKASVSVIEVMPKSPAEEAGIKLGDQILTMKTAEISLQILSEKDVSDFVEAYRGEEIILVIQRGSKVLEIQATPRWLHPDNEGPLGIALARVSTERTPFFLAPIEGFRILLRSAGLIIIGFGSMIKDIFVDGRAPEQVSGPVGIFFLARDMRALGFSFFLQFVGALSTTLAVLNFLPIPALDGGRALFLAIEKLKGRRINPKVENMAHAFGFVILIFLMVLVTYRDIVRFF